jgi:hypothetical protein
MSSSKSKPKAVDSRSSEQKAIAAILGPYLQGNMYNGASVYSGDLVADLPVDLKKYFENAMKIMSEDSELVRGALQQQASGKAAYEFDERKTQKQFQESFARPVMQAWEKNVMPVIEQQYAGMPGSMFSTHRAKGVSNAAEAYYSQNVQPQMFNAYQADLERGFQSGEAAAARQLGAASALQSMPYTQFSQTAAMAESAAAIDQMKLQAAYQEFLRTAPENNPWLQYQLAFLGTPMMTVAQESKGPSFGYAAGTAILGGAAQGYASTLGG